MSNALIENRLLVICRRLYGDDLLRLMEALYEGGIRLAEVTFDQSDPVGIPRTCEAIESLNRCFGRDMQFGIGTVITAEQVKAAVHAGARFIVSPNVNEKVITATKTAGLLSVAGAMTPTEILQAYTWGADVVKVFPAEQLGLSYVKAIRAPISHVPLLAAGGVTEENIRAYSEAGFRAFGISGRLCDRQAIARGEWAELTCRARRFAEALL